ncbi:MAG: DUF2061 domain-containing protein [Phenylobacterium sp.]|jgi:uncharacterized membrane protein|uniref:DUF2061 domain-containing protein n=1 Tax=Phenylobacterium sp. TaxID=1871053 RepID=UPI00391A0F7D
MRTLKKTISYSLTHLTVAVAVAYGLTQDWRAALAIGLIEPIFQTVAFAVHERVWERIGRGNGTPAAELRSATA